MTTAVPDLSRDPVGAPRLLEGWCASEAPADHTEHVAPIACRAHGLCAEMLPDLVRLDEWGYPIIAPDRVAPDRRRDARAAVRACPSLALRLQPVDPR